MTSLSDLGEFGLIKRFSRQFIKDLPDGTTGIGDDCAVIPLNDKEALLFTTDMLIEDRHFVLSKIGPRDLGHKSLAVNLSDIAAMGGKPHSAYLSIGIPSNMRIEWLDGLFDGIRELCSKTGTYLLGGDTTRSPDKLVINIGIIGMVNPSKIKRRSTALPGDIICVNDMVGDSGGGLKILLEEKPLDKYSSYLVKRHNCPGAHLEEGKWLAQVAEVNAMIDVSDGIESDLHRIMESSAVGAEIELSKIPLSGELMNVCEKYDWNPRELGLSGGEDYCLMITVPENYIENLETGYVREFKKPLYRIGKINGNRESLTFTRDGEKIEFGKHGFDHFKSK